MKRIKKKKNVNKGIRVIFIKVFPYVAYTKLHSLQVIQYTTIMILKENVTFRNTVLKILILLQTSIKLSVYIGIKV